MTEQRDHYEAVYGEAGGDAAHVPWADLAPKPELIDWLSAHEADGTAIDVACGLGDNAEALAEAGWRTTAFDISAKAIDWARHRFPDTQVEYQTADLFGLPPAWIGGFDLVNESYIFQTMPPDTLPRSVPAICSLVKPGGRLLVYSRLRKEGAAVQGPPWPLEPSAIDMIAGEGLTLQHRKDFILKKDDRQIPHAFMVWSKPL